MAGRLDVIGYQQEIHRLLSDTSSLDSKAAEITLRAGDELYEIDSSQISHIDFPSDFTPIPGAQRWVVGVCHSKGRVVVVIDFAIMQGLPKTKNGRLLVLKSRDIALMAEIETAATGLRKPFPLTEVIDRALPERP